MKLKNILVKNYRSIDEQSFVVEEIDKSSTFTLIGINESGKSSFLTAVSLVDEGGVSARDFFDESKPIEVALTYAVEDNDMKVAGQELVNKGIDKDLVQKIKINEVTVGVQFDNSNNYARKNFERIIFAKQTIPEYLLNESLPVKKTDTQSGADLDLAQLFEAHIPDHFYKHSHVITFWKSDPKHLIGEPIDLNAFSEHPKDVSVPLANCFRLAGIENIKTAVEHTKEDAARRQNLQSQLSDAVTAHIKKVWPNHPITIKFDINNMMLEFLIEDEEVRYKAKTTAQRSDGFKQFISFLLTISAESRTSILSRSLLLLDEPETHLHPKAQEFLREELIAITKNKNNNLVFFATHSNYMIDRKRMDRCYKVEKVNNSSTKISKIDEGASSYAEVNYDVFGILSSDYHNELYGLVQDKAEKGNLNDFEEYLVEQKIPRDKKYIKIRKDSTDEEQTITWPTYIRNMIHHPENTKNEKFTDGDLEKSIKILLKLKNSLK